MTFSFPAARLARTLGTAVLGAALMSACGGSSSQVDKFTPQRVLSFGDELNYLTDDGYKYTVNALTTTAPITLACSSSPLWVQYMAASSYDKVFSQCQGDATSPDVTAYRVSTVGARVDDLVTQVNSYTAGAGFNENDLVTVLVGMHDVLDAYQTEYTGDNEADVLANLAVKGALLAAQVNKIVGTGARVLISTVPDMGLTPYALQEKADKGDDRAKLLTRMTDAFNKAMRLDLINDGSKLGLLLADDLTRAMVRVPDTYSLTNVKDAACDTDTAPMPTCTTETLTTAANDKSGDYLWADTLRPGAIWHQYLGRQAVSRLNTLPF